MKRAVPLATRCSAEFDLTFGIVFKCGKMCINLLLTPITTAEISKIKLNTQKPSPFHSVNMPSEHGSALGSSMAFSLYKRTEIKDELLGCVLFSLLWTGCNSSVLEEWKVCGVQKVGHASLLSPSHRAESVTQQGATICYQRTLQSFLSSPLRRFVVHTWQKQEKWLCSSMSKQEKKKKSWNCWTNKLPFRVSGHLLFLSLNSYFSVHIFYTHTHTHTGFKYGWWWTIKGGLLPSQWVPFLLPKVNLSSALISIVP